MTSKKLVVLLVENGCKQNVLDDEFCKTVIQYKAPKKKKTASDVNNVDLYRDNIIAIKRSDIELKERDESFEIKPCLEDYHIDNINDYIENKIDDVNVNQDEIVYILLHEVCDHVDDIKKLNDKNFEIRTFIHIVDKEKEIEEDEEIKNNIENDNEKEKSENSADDAEKKQPNDTETDDKTQVEENKTINISEKIGEHFMDETNYAKYKCLENIITHKIDAWNMIKHKNGNNIGYKNIFQICQELRMYLYKIVNEWNLYDSNWRNENENDTKCKIETITIPDVQLKNINEYEIYNKCINNMKSINVCSVIYSMIEQIANDDNENDININENNNIINEDENSGVYRYGDILSQNNYLNKICKNEIEINKKILNQCSELFIKSLFDEYKEMDKNIFESQTTARYTFSKLEPSIFDDALIYKEFNELLSLEINDRIFREDLNKTELFQRIKDLNNNQFIKCNKKYLKWMDCIILSYYINKPLTQHQNTNMSVFLSSNIGFREWIKLPQTLKHIKPNIFYQSNQKRFLYNNTISIYTPYYKNWFMGLSSFDNTPNTTHNKPYLWLRNYGLNQANSVISISKYDNKSDKNIVNFSVQFPDFAELSFISKSDISTIINKSETENVENNNETTETENENENKENTETEEIITTQSKNKNDIIYISLPNDIIVEYHYKYGELIMYYQNALKQYEIQQQNEINSTKTDESSNDSNTNEKEVENKDKIDENNPNEDDETPQELESIDVTWNNNDNIFIVYRKIDKEGIITIYYSDNSQRKLFPSSEIWYKQSLESKWIIVKSNGECMIDTEIKKPINIATTTDSDTNTKIVTREDNVLVFCHSNGDGFIQYPDSTHIFVQSNISQKEWDLYTLSKWMENMGVDKESSCQISNLSQNTIKETAEKLKHDLTQIKFELKNDCKMPTVIVHPNNNTQIKFYNGFNATFVHPNISEKVIASIEHISTGKFEIYNETKNIHFIPNKSEINENNTDSIMYTINLNNENPSIAINEYKITLNGEYNVNDKNEIINNVINPRLFVVYRDGNSYELLSKDTFTEYCKYLQKNELKSQILQPKPLLPTVDNSPISHRFIMERFVNNAPRQAINIPSVLCDTLKTKLNTYKDNEMNRNCSIYRHLLETNIISKRDIEIAQKDLLNFENWLQLNENKLKLENSNEINEINKEMIEQRNKLKQETNLSGLELKFTLTNELKRSKLEKVNEELQRNEKELSNVKDSQEMKETKEIMTNNKENEDKARQIRNTQKQNEQKISEKENVSYFANEPCLRDYEISQYLSEIFCYFVNIWKDDELYNETNDKLFISTLSLLKTVCIRLRKIISIKTSNGNLKLLKLNDEIMINLQKNEFITNNINKLLCSIGFQLDSNGYIPKQTNIFIDAGICYVLCKLDEYHSKYKKYLFKINNKQIDYVKSFEMDLKTKIINNLQDTDINNIAEKRHNKKYNNNNNATSPSSYSIITENKPKIERCISHCSCCPIDSPERATKMDYLGRSRKNIISMDDLDKYPKPVSDIQFNMKHINTEGDVQRKTRTISTFPQSLNSIDAFPTIVIQPHCFDFGDIYVGNVYRFTASITNHGNNQARFNIIVNDENNNYNSNHIHIKPYYRCGGIAPGITILLEIEFYTKYFKGTYINNLIIKTQKHVFNVNIKANVMENNNHINNSSIQQLINNNNKKSRVTCLGPKY